MAIRHNRAKAARDCGASGRGCRAGSGDVTETAQSCVWKSAPIIHPLAPISAGGGVCQLVSIEVTLSCREKTPHSRQPQKTRNRVAIVGRPLSFRNAADVHWAWRMV